MIKAEAYRAILFFLLAGLCEIGGGYLIWGAIKKGYPAWIGISGGVILAAYGLVAALQPAGFGRTYAAYGGVFVIMALLWGWIVDKAKPDVYDIIGAAIVVLGAALIFFAPREIIVEDN